MRVRTLLILGALAAMLAGCTHSVAGEEDSTRDFSFDIVQTADPPVIGNTTRIDVPFEITIVNKTDAPVTVSRIAIQSFEVGDYQIPFRSRPFEKVIAPGAKEKIEFWANAIVTDPTLGTRAPLTMRTMVDFESPSGARHEVFVRGINGRIGFGMQKPIG
jgi:hypothetical protein